ncbi:tRNA (adenine(22)-N(1))-methyltransferase TrmK [Vibrio sp.]|nr:tRNA (adenine(22)-N(1))-methyltransferase TrmK [Vibrio sp.]
MVNKKLSKRLNGIVDMINSFVVNSFSIENPVINNAAIDNPVTDNLLFEKTQYDHIWDCCCDHGFLGAYFLEHHDKPHVHFVDIVPSLIEIVRSRLSQFYPHLSHRWDVYCHDVAQLPLETHQGKHLIMIAGVGGELLSNFITSIIQHCGTQDIDFVVCPVNNAYEVRQTLKDNEFLVIDEQLLEENRRFYEIIYCTRSNEHLPTITVTGHSLWQIQDHEQQSHATMYLQKLLTHYRKIQQGGKQDVSHIVSAYESIKL